MNARPNLDRLDVIAVGAHPDDMEIACGGTLARLVELGYRVAIVDLTDGEPTPVCPSPQVRRDEACEAANVLGVQRVILDLPNRRLFDNFESRVVLATIFRQRQPRLVIGLAGKTPLASPDHWQAAQITDAAVFYSRLSKWDEYFAGLPPHKIDAQLYCRLSFEISHDAASHSEVTMDISETLDKKLQSIRCYKTQFPPEKAYVLERVRAVALHAGASAGFRAGETFGVPRMLGTRDLVKTVLEQL